MKLTREEALKLHRQMWTDMQKELGDNPNIHHRASFKKYWLDKHFPGEAISGNCFLCEYANNTSDSCRDCPIDWGADTSEDKEYCHDCDEATADYRKSPISEILALPEREVKWAMILTDEQIKADDERWKCRDVKQELRYIGYATPTRTSVTNDDIKFVACMARKALRILEHGMSAYRIDTDGTLWLTVESVEELDKVSRVIVEHGTWCKQFYMDGASERPKGHWIPQDVSSGRDSWKCSVCGRRARGKIENLPYCHCGADMRSEEIQHELQKKSDAE